MEDRCHPSPLPLPFSSQLQPGQAAQGRGERGLGRLGLSSPHKVIDPPQHPVLSASLRHGAPRLQMAKLRSKVERTHSGSHRAPVLVVCPSGSQAPWVIHPFTCSLICIFHCPSHHSSTMLLFLGPYLESLFTVFLLPTVLPHPAIFKFVDSTF